MFMFTTLSFMRFFHKPEIKNILSFSLLKSHNHKQSITCLICPLQFFLIPHKRCIFNKKFKLHFSQSPIWIAEKKKKKTCPSSKYLVSIFFLQILLWKWFQWKLCLSTPCHLRHFYCSFPPQSCFWAGGEKAVGNRLCCVWAHHLTPSHLVHLFQDSKSWLNLLFTGDKEMTHAE